MKKYLPLPLQFGGTMWHVQSLPDSPPLNPEPHVSPDNQGNFRELHNIECTSYICAGLLHPAVPKEMFALWIYVLSV